MHLLLLDILTQRCNDKLISVKNLFSELFGINCWLINYRVAQLSESLYQILYKLRASHFLNQTVVPILICQFGSVIEVRLGIAY